MQRKELLSEVLHLQLTVSSAVHTLQIVQPYTHPHTQSKNSTTLTTDSRRKILKRLPSF